MFHDYNRFQHFHFVHIFIYIFFFSQVGRIDMTFGYLSLKNQNFIMVVGPVPYCYPVIDICGELHLQTLIYVYIQEM